MTSQPFVNLTYNETCICDEKNRSRIELKRFKDGTAYAVIRSELGGGQMIELKFTKEDVKKLISILND